MICFFPAVMSFLVLLNQDHYCHAFSKAFGFILKPSGKIAMYIYIFHYPMIIPVCCIVGSETTLQEDLPVAQDLPTDTLYKLISTADQQGYAGRDSQI